MVIAGGVEAGCCEPLRNGAWRERPLMWDQGPAVRPHLVQFVVLVYPFSILCAFNGILQVGPTAGCKMEQKLLLVWVMRATRPVHFSLISCVSALCFHLCGECEANIKKKIHAWCIVMVWQKLECCFANGPLFWEWRSWKISELDNQFSLVSPVFETTH